MNSYRFLFLKISAVALVLSVPAAHAQTQDQQQQTPPSDSSPSAPDAPVQPLSPDQNGGTRTPPVPAGRGVFIGSGGGGQDADASVPDTNVLSGVETLGLGYAYGSLHKFAPTLFVSESADTGIIPGRWEATTTVGGTLQFGHAWHSSLLRVAYSGGDTIYRQNGSYLNSPFQEADFSARIRWSRYTLAFRDSLLISPQSPFGNLNLGGPALIGQIPGLNSLVPTIAPVGSTILTGWVTQLSNIPVVELDYALSRRSGLSVSGSAGELHFFSAGYVNSHYESGQAGYNHTLSGKNSVALNYTFTQTVYSGVPGHQQTHSLQASFGRKITGRLAFQISGGPQLTISENPGQSNFQTTYASGFASLSYQQRRTGYSVSFYRGFTAGSGVFFGSNSNTFSAAINRRLTRLWSGSAAGGYSSSDSLTPVGLTSTNFSTYYATANASRQVGRHLNLSVGYSFEGQTSNGICPVLNCGIADKVHVISVNVNWHLRPIG
jgi:hypothetical protein